MVDKNEILKSFWNVIESNKYTWEDLNRGKDITFTYNGKEYTANTRLGNFWSMGINEYQRMIEQRAIDTVKEE